MELQNMFKILTIFLWIAVLEIHGGPNPEPAVQLRDHLRDRYLPPSTTTRRSIRFSTTPRTPRPSPCGYLPPKCECEPKIEIIYKDRIMEKKIFVPQIQVQIKEVPVIKWVKEACEVPTTTTPAPCPLCPVKNCSIEIPDHSYKYPRPEGPVFVYPVPESRKNSGGSQSAGGNPIFDPFILSAPRERRSGGAGSQNQGQGQGQGQEVSVNGEAQAPWWNAVIESYKRRFGA